MTKKEIATLLVIVATAYQNYSISETTVDLWNEIIGGMDFDLAKKSLKVYISQGKDFAPNPGHIKQIAIRLTNPIELAQTAGEAWELCCMAASGSGTDHPDLSARGRAAARQVGWDRIRYADQDTDLPFVRNNFIRAFNDLEERADAIAAQAALPALATNLIGMTKPKRIQ